MARAREIHSFGKRKKGVCTCPSMSGTTTRLLRKDGKIGLCECGESEVKVLLGIETLPR